MKVTLSFPTRFGGRFPDKKGSLRAFTLVELLVVVAILAISATLVFVVGRKVFLSSSLATSANNIRQLAAGSATYLAENNYVFWPYRAASTDPNNRGVMWWWGFEPQSSLGLPEGKRIFNKEEGPLGSYIPGGMRPDPSFAFGGNTFKPKYQFGFIGVGYNVLLGGGWMGTAPRLRYWDLENPDKTVVFATSAQINTFQKPASAKNPMIEEFYGIDQNFVTVHFRHQGNAMVAFASGSAGFLPIDESTRDRRAPAANVGRFAPRGSDKHLR